MKKSFVVGALMLTAAAVAAPAAQATTTVTITASSAGAKIVGTPTAGYQAFHLERGKKEVDVDIALLKKGVSVAKATTVFRKLRSPTEAEKFATLIGGNAGAPSYSFTTKLAKGNYVLIDSTSALKVIGSFTVTAVGDADAPKADGTITMMDFLFHGMHIPAHGLLKVPNDGPSLHFMVYIPVKNIADGRKAAALVKAGKEGQAQKYAIGAPGSIVSLISPGVTDYVPVNLKRGAYVIACFYSDGRSHGKEHSRLGMEEVVTVE